MLEDMTNVKPGVLNFLIIGLIAVTFIVLAKFAFTRYHVPGLSELFQAV